MMDVLISKMMEISYEEKLFLYLNVLGMFYEKLNLFASLILILIMIKNSVHCNIVVYRYID